MKWQRTRESPLGLLDRACTQAGPTSSHERRVAQHTFTHASLINESSAALTYFPTTAASCIGPACEAGLSIDAWKGACVTADSEQWTVNRPREFVIRPTTKLRHSVPQPVYKDAERRGRTHNVRNVDAAVVLSSDDAEAKSFAGLLHQIQRENLVEVFVVGEAGECLVAQDGQPHDAWSLSQNLRRPLVCHFTAEVFAICLDAHIKPRIHSFIHSFVHSYSFKHTHSLTHGLSRAKRIANL